MAEIVNIKLEDVTSTVNVGVDDTPVSVNVQLQGGVVYYGGDADANYIHTQNTPSSTWVVTHGLNKYPSISVVDSANTIVEGLATYNDINNVTIEFNGSFTGKAYFN